MLLQQSKKNQANLSDEAAKLLDDIQKHIVGTLGNDFKPARKDTLYQGLAYAVKDRLAEKWLANQRGFYDRGAKRVYYLSMEFLPGRFLVNYITSLGIEEEVREALKDTGFTLEELESEEFDAGLGNGGLGRLASCFMDSMATLGVAGYGYGIRYDYGIFYQTITNGYQHEHADNWIKKGSPWEFARRGFLHDVNFYGRSEAYSDENGRLRYRWIDTQKVGAMACDILVPGYKSEAVNNMRLWAALSNDEFELTSFNKGDYMGAMEAKVMSENISKVLYPNDDKETGKELRLKQQYFLVAATFQDIIRRFKRKSNNFEHLSDQIAVQLNDTHPTIAIAELMRILVDIEGVEWDKAWEICTKTFAYTNHTVLPEALETWSVDLMNRLLPRHMQIIYAINEQFLEFVKSKYPSRNDLLSKLSLIDEGFPKRVRMAHLAIVGSHTVNGVAALHSDILKNELFREFSALYPEKFTNVTNGVTPRRWILQANPKLTDLISKHIGSDWIANLDLIKKIEDFATDEQFKESWSAVKKENKIALASYILRKTGVEVNVNSMFDVHIKRIHEYKRQLLNALHVIALYNELRKYPNEDFVPRTVIFAGKAAPAYKMAKLIIKFINNIAKVVNSDPKIGDKLKVVFLPNYCITQAEKIIPATDLSEQVSTAGMEASGTGNMKFAMNGALTIGTLDGANVEIAQQVGDENIFIFGLTAEEVVQTKKDGYNPHHYIDRSPTLQEVLGLIRSNHFSKDEVGLFDPILESLLEKGDKYLVCADFDSFVAKQKEVSDLYRNRSDWVEKSILNSARMGMFSSDRSIKEYAKNIWKVKCHKE